MGTIFPGELNNQPRSHLQEVAEPGFSLGWSLHPSLSVFLPPQNTHNGEERFHSADPNNHCFLVSPLLSVRHLPIKKQLVWDRKPRIWHQNFFLLVAVSVFVLPNLPKQKYICFPLSQ